MTFIQTLIDNSDQRQLDVFFESLTEKYICYVMNCLKRASSIGKKEAFINFPINDFRINIRNTGDPKWACTKWLERLSSDGYQLQGVRYDVWGNTKFTTKFSW
tara:strand:- start:3378 stop:3686 length:309 start_codon:yes stop_codon:yes gene_type:complete